MRRTTIAAAAALTVVLRDGWLRSGDLVRRDEQGWYAVVDRLGDLDVDAVLAATRERIAACTLPRRIHVVDAVPRTAAGKPLRRLLRAVDATTRIEQEAGS